MSSLNAMHQLERVTGFGDEVEPAPGHHQVLRHTQHLVGYRVAMMMVIKQPAVKIPLPQGRLDGSKVHGANSLFNHKSFQSPECRSLPKSRATARDRYSHEAPQ